MAEWNLLRDRRGGQGSVAASATTVLPMDAPNIECSRRVEWVPAAGQVTGGRT